MNAGTLVFLGGLFGVPMLLLAYGHRIRRRGPRARRTFWGAVIGHCLAGCLAVAFGMFPPEAWTADDTLRGFAGLWSLLVLPIVGAVLAMLTYSPDVRSAPRR